MEREYCSEDGAARLAGAGGDRAARFREALTAGLEAIGVPSGVPVVISGMAGSSIGWSEVPYAGLPFPLEGSKASWKEIEEGVFLIGGVCSGEDVMRGEETQAIGWMAGSKELGKGRSMLVLPGTHSKHVRVEDEAIAGFQTYLTGELFEVMARHSVLRHSVEVGAPLDEAEFREGVRESGRNPLSAALFRVRTRQVLSGVKPRTNASFLSGLLVGSEMASAAKYEGPVVVASGESFGRAYLLAAEVLGFSERTSFMDSRDLCAMGQERMLTWIFKQKQSREHRF